ncbi:hypothetical protein HanRHA438_Chr13g0609211 [Helianthus annuus]|nr:hypothetical protein HanRHA438_Chr13g0609211 [Helianthus annuus]
MPARTSCGHECSSENPGPRDAVFARTRFHFFFFFSVFLLIYCASAPSLRLGARLFAPQQRSFQKKTHFCA